jgi:zinc protease
MPQPAVNTPPEQVSTSFDFVVASGGIEEYRHKKNNLQVLLLPDATAPVVTLMVTYRVGSRNESMGLTGATHMLEHLMFKGTKRYNKKDGTSIFNALQRVGARVNATTWLDRTNYYELLPREHLPLAVEIEADRMRGALISTEDLESERTVILNEFDRGDNEPMRKLYLAVWSTAFMAHPYHHPTIGWRSDIEHATSGGLRHFYDTFYWPDNATVSVIGDLDREATLDLLDGHFGAITPAPAPIPEVHTREPRQRGTRRITVRQAGQLGLVMVAYKSPSALEPDVDALEVLSIVLATGKNSRLYRRLTDNALTTHIMTSVSRLRDPGLFYIFAMLAPGHTHESIEEQILEEVERVKEEGITEAELRRAKSKIKAEVAFSRDGSFSVASELNEAIAAGDWKLYSTLLDRIERVTADDVQRVARQYCTEDVLTVGYYDPT